MLKFFKVGDVSGGAGFEGAFEVEVVHGFLFDEALSFHFFVESHSWRQF